MKPNVFLRIVAPVLAVSILPLIVGVVAAWRVHADQKSASNALDLDVQGVRSGANLEIGIRDIRTDLNQFLVAKDKNKRQLREILEHRKLSLDHWLREARHAAVTDRERKSVNMLRDGYDRFFSELRDLTEQPLGSEVLEQRVHTLLPRHAGKGRAGAGRGILEDERRGHQGVQRG